MRVLILSVSDKRHMPMISPYIEYLNSKGILYDIIRLNRYDCISKIVSSYQHNLGNIYEINIPFNVQVKRAEKLIHFVKFRHIANRIMSNTKYSFIIVWNENTTALFSDILAGKYKNRFCLNIRDVYSEQIGIKQLVEYAMKYANFITVPSPEFIINNQNSICLFNRDTNLLKNWTFKNSLCPEEQPIRITHLGFYLKAKKAANDLADLFGNDKRFQLKFYGSGFDTDFRKYVNSRGYNNIITGGPFPYEETARILDETDIINSYYNMYDQASLSISFGIKHSYTPMLHIPGLADENTCWGRLSKPYNLAYLVNDKNLKSLPNDLYNWYRSLDFEEFCKKCDKFSETIIESQKNMFKLMDKALKL